MIEAYCGRQSYGAGDYVAVHVSTSSSTFTLRVLRYRLQPEEVHVAARIKADEYPIPADVVANGCDWPASYVFEVPEDWPSGFYMVRIVSEDGELAEAFFVVRTQRTRNSILWVIETNTWNAYNNFGGASTYIADKEVYANGAARVSFDRPFPRGTVSLPKTALRLATIGEPDTSIPYVAWSLDRGVSPFTGAASWGQWGSVFADWLEEQGIAVDYAVSSDLEEFPGLLDGYRLYLSVGHDEYWSWAMRDAVESFIVRGGNAMFLSGNTSYWQVRLEKNRKQMVAFKAKVDEDPVMSTSEERRNTGMWSHRLTRRPENEMTGLSFTRGGYARFAGATPASSGGYTIYRPTHWALEGTGLSYGDELGGKQSIVGYECDGCLFQFQHGRPVPTGADGTPGNFEIIAIAPVALWSKQTAPPGYFPDGVLSDLELVGEQLVGSHAPEVTETFAYGHAVMGTYVSAGGGQVFSAGTTDWVFGLVDAQVARITKNVIVRLSRIDPA